MRRLRLPRSFRRLLLTASLLLLAGAVVNVGVAWVLVGAPDSWMPQRLRRLVTIDEGDPAPASEELISITRNLQKWDGLAVATTASVEKGFGRTSVGAARLDTGPGDLEWIGFTVAAGWPAHSMTVTWLHVSGHRMRFSPSILPARDLVEAGWINECPLPLTPIRAGFAINTLFYAALLALPLSFFPIRRRLRARRGRCPKCGYDLAGFEQCPECGATS